MREYKQVSKAEYDKFVESYPAKLDWDVTGICEPPMGRWNLDDGTMWPDCMVAKVNLYDGSAYHEGKQPEYFILEVEQPTELDKTVDDMAVFGTGVIVMPAGKHLPIGEFLFDQRDIARKAFRAWMRQFRVRLLPSYFTRKPEKANKHNRYRGK